MSISCYERPGKLPNYFYPEILKVDLGDFKITDEFIEEFLALKHFGCEYRRYTYIHRYSCSNVMEYSRNVLTELRKIRKHLLKNNVDPDFYDDWLLDEVIKQLETIIEYGRLIKNKVKRNDFLRTFDFGFFDTWKEKLEDIDIHEEMSITDSHWNPLVDYNLGGDPKYDED